MESIKILKEKNTVQKNKYEILKTQKAKELRELLRDSNIADTQRFKTLSDFITKFDKNNHYKDIVGLADLLFNERFVLNLFDECTYIPTYVTKFIDTHKTKEYSKYMTYTHDKYFITYYELELNHLLAKINNDEELSTYIRKFEQKYKEYILNYLSTFEQSCETYIKQLGDDELIIRVQIKEFN